MSPRRSAGHDGAHERAHITDSRFYAHAYATDASRRIFCDVCRYQRWLDIEAALALAQAELGLVPVEQAERIAAAAQVERLDLELVRREIRRTGHSLVAFLRALQDACEDGAGEFIHYGATTQDIQDTGQAMEMGEVLHEAERELAAIVAILAPLARSHAETLIVGRSHARAALPMTFGLKVAGWLDELLRHAERLEECASRVVVAQLFGGVGTMAGFGDHGEALLERFAHRLGLGVPALCWHVARDRVAEYVSTLAALSGTLARILDEVRTLSRPELGELEEAWRPGKVGSSTMPHKRNPEECQQVVVLARLAAAQVPLALQAMIGEHERDSRSLRLEWPMVADVSHYALAALAISGPILGGLVVHEDVMAANAEDSAGAVCSESLMLALGDHIGKQSAHTLVYELCQEAQNRNLPLRQHLRAAPAVRKHLGDEELARIFEPSRYVGRAPELATRTAERAERWLAARQPEEKLVA
ncbi:MAG TPA: adenylosuccinate lyase family protein [Solirubrobacteraceae bacterium]|nr:adenylosuccinate lyase family protein [Solirubrobacteraceae bacterium]